MDRYIDKIVQTIGDYRKEDNISINHDHVKSWLDQFDKNDQKPLIQELGHLLPQSYLSKDSFVKNIEKTLTRIAKDCDCSDVQEFVRNTKFLSCQGDTKSQTAFLSLLNETTSEIFNTSIHECDEVHAKYWFYIDDVLASGKTFYDDFTREINTFGAKEYQSRKIKTVCLFHFLHSWGFSNKINSLNHLYNFSNQSIKAYYFKLIENRPDPNKHNKGISFNNVYPMISRNAATFLDRLPAKLNITYKQNNREVAFRQPDQPKYERFYSNPEARNIYEEVVLRMGIDIMDKVDHFEVPSIRPLGMVPPSYLTLGAGSHAFTWRNISNTCPLIFWWEGCGWIPLFPVKGRGK